MVSDKISIPTKFEDRIRQGDRDEETSISSKPVMYKYIYMKEKLGNFGSAHQLFDNWCKYRQCVNNIPHDTFYLPKFWVMAAHFEFELPQLNHDGARSFLVREIRIAPKVIFFKYHTQIELQHGNINMQEDLP